MLSPQGCVFPAYSRNSKKSSLHPYRSKILRLRRVLHGANDNIPTVHQVRWQVYLFRPRSLDTD